jgi:hypothetical protein
VRNRIRIESHENVVTDARIFYVPEEGEEVDISRCVQGIDLHLHVGEISRASLHCILVDGDVTAEIEEVFLKRLVRPRRRWWHRWFPRDPIEVTRYGDRGQSYVPGLKGRSE